ncbi:MAG TPA: type II secretion system protein N [Marinobacter sp.]|nr:type II secretion system protein N [Marinobacter sp.]
MNLVNGFARLGYRFHNACTSYMTESRPTSFFGPGKLALLFGLGLLVYAVTLVVWLPAGWLWQKAAGQVVLPPQVDIRQVSGQLWDGAAGVVVAGIPARIEWQLGWPDLSGLSLPVSFGVSSSQSRISGLANVAWSGHYDVNARGQIKVAEFESLIRQSGGAMIEGEVMIERFHLAGAPGRLEQADGLGRWDGGLVTWPMGNDVGQAEFPPMLAMLDTLENGLSLTIQAQEGEGPAADVSILWDGMMEIRVYKRMIDLAGQPWPDSAQPGDVVFQVRQPVLPGGF